MHRYSALHRFHILRLCATIAGNRTVSECANSFSMVYLLWALLITVLALIPWWEIAWNNLSGIVNHGESMQERIGTAQIVQTTTAQNPDGLPIGAFRMSLFFSPDPTTEDASFADAADYDPATTPNVSFTLTQPGGYYVECTRLTQAGQPIGPTATSSTQFIGDGTATFQAPLVITFGVSGLL